MMSRGATHLLAAIAVLGLLLVAPVTAQAAPVGKKHVRGHIVTGSPVGFAVGWQVGLVEASGGNVKVPFDVFCGGTIRDATHIITAAHCVPDSNAEDIRVVANLYRRSDGTAFGAQIARVSAISSHPSYTRTDAGNDLAVLTLADPVNAAGAKPVTAANANWVGANALISGWGLLFDKGPVPNELYGAQVSVLPDSWCNGYEQGFISATMICAGLPNGALTVDTCQGDSGGPLMAFAGGVHTLIGVVSFGRGCADPNFPGVYTKLANPDLNARAKDANPAPRAEPVDGASIQGTPTPGQTLTCAPGQWRNHSGDFIFTWLSAVRGADGKFSDVRPEPAGPALALTDAHANRVVGCAATSVGPGGARQSGANLVTVAAAPVPAAAPPAPPVTIPGDLVAPTSRFTRRSCKKRKCSLTITASDSGGPAMSVRVTYQRITGCRKGKKGAKCRKAKTLKAKKRGKGVFTVTTPKLAPARYRFTVVATDASGNRSKKTSVVLRVKR